MCVALSVYVNIFRIEEKNKKSVDNATQNRYTIWRIAYRLACTTCEHVARTPPQMAANFVSIAGRAAFVNTFESYDSKALIQKRGKMGIFTSRLIC